MTIAPLIAGDHHGAAAAPSSSARRGARPAFGRHNTTDSLGDLRRSTSDVPPPEVAADGAIARRATAEDPAEAAEMARERGRRAIAGRRASEGGGGGKEEPWVSPGGGHGFV